MNTQVNSFLGQTEGGTKAFFGGGKHRIHPLNYLLHIGVMLAISKVFIILFLLSWGTWNTLATFKANH